MSLAFQLSRYGVKAVSRNQLPDFPRDCPLDHAVT